MSGNKRRSKNRRAKQRPAAGDGEAVVASVASDDHKINEYPLTDFMKACQAGNMEEAMRLFQQDNSRLSEQNQDGGTALTFAAASGRVLLVRWLLQKGASAEHKTHQGVTPLMAACRKGHPEVVRLLLSEGGADPLAADANGVSALCYAALSGHVAVIESLLHPKASPFAGQDGTDEKAPARRADLMQRDRRQTTPLIAAASGRHLSAVQYLLSEGAPVDSRDNDGVTALFTAASHGDLPLVQLLLKHNADPSLSNMQGMTPCLIAASRAHNSVVEYLLKEGGSRLSVEDKNQQGDTVLVYAAASGNLQLVRRLLSPPHNADVNSRNSRLATPLMAAAANGQYWTAGVLLDHDADCDLKTESGDTAAAIASRNGHADTCALIRHWTAVRQAAEGKRDVDAEVTPGQSDSPLHHACRARAYNTILKLLQRQANPLKENRQSRDCIREYTEPDLGGRPLPQVLEIDQKEEPLYVKCLDKMRARGKETSQRSKAAEEALLKDLEGLGASVAKPSTGGGAGGAKKKKSRK